MDEKTQGIVLRARAFSDTSLIVHWLTEDCGRLATMVKGAKRPKSPFRGKLDLCFTNQLAFRRNPKGDLHTLKEVVLIDSRPWMRSHYAVLQKVASAVSLMELGTETDTPTPELYVLFSEFLDALKLNPDRVEILCAFEARFLDWSGLLPEIDQVPVSKDVRKTLEAWTQATWNEIAEVELSSAIRTSGAGWLRSVMGNEYGRLPKGRDAVFAAA